MSTSQDPFGESGRSDAPPSDGPRSGGQLPRILFWVLIVALYFLGALSLLVRGWLDVNPTGAESPIASLTTVATAIATPEEPATITLPPATFTAPPPTPFPTLTPRRTLYPTLTPRP